jgi:hypothetical protein
MRLSIRVALAASGALLGCSAFAQEKPSSAYRDVTATHMPQEPELHALDALVIDVDKDGDNDVVLAVEHDENRLYLNDGQGHLSWKKGALGSHRYDSEHVRSADFDRDGFPDLVFVAEDDRHHQLFFGRPGGAFVDASDRLLAQSQGNAVAVGDVNGDSLPDILVGNSAEPRPGQERGSMTLPGQATSSMRAAAIFRRWTTTRRISCLSTSTVTAISTWSWRTSPRPIDCC